MQLAKDIPADAIQQVNLLDSGIMKGDAQPAAGKFNFTPLQEFVAKTLFATETAKEDAHVVVLNGSGVAGLAQTEADKVTKLGLTVDGVDNAPKGSATTTTIYQITDTPFPQTIAALTKQYGVKPQLVTSVPGVTVGENTNFVIIVQKDSGAVAVTPTTTQ